MINKKKSLYLLFLKKNFYTLLYSMPLKNLLVHQREIMPYRS